MMDAAGRDGQHDILIIWRPQCARAGALRRAKLRDSDEAESELKQRRGLRQWGSDGWSPWLMES